MRRILLTNDDGIDSPALLPFARALRVLGEVRIVVPDNERSWVAKAITRFEPVHLRAVDREEFEVLACSGYPADAVQLGIHAAPEPPDLVVSGINLGYNHGVGFLMSSGTVGAAVEGWISGIPAVAVSTGTMADWQEWRRQARDPASSPRWHRTGEVAAAIIEDLLAAGVPALADVVSINMPFDPAPDTPRRLTSIARVGYDRLFRPDGEGVYVHDYGGGFRQFDVLDGTDVAAAHRSEIAVTALRMPQSVELPEEVRIRFERGDQT